MQRPRTPQLPQPVPRSVLGIMSGTSLDGVDYAVCRIHGRPPRPGGTRVPIELLHHTHVRFPTKLAQTLHQAAKGSLLVHDAARLHHDLGRFYAKGAARVPERFRVHLAGLHGQTVFHGPDGLHPATLQLGEPAYLAAALGCPVVSNFRSANLAVGGQGAPLAQSFHATAFSQPGRRVGFLNLGGIANITLLDATRGAATPDLAFDTGPANMLIDLATRHWTGGRARFDRDGRLAAQGTIRTPVLHRWLRQGYFSKPPPKSTGREIFGERFLERAIRDLGPACPAPDALATLTELTVETVARSIERFLPPLDRLVIAGGGACNRHLVTRLTQRLAAHTQQVITSGDLGWPPGAIEPAAFAWLAWLRWNQIAPAVEQSTGADKRVLLGQITEL